MLCRPRRHGGSWAPVILLLAGREGKRGAVRAMQCCKGRLRRVAGLWCRQRRAWCHGMPAGDEASLISPAGAFGSWWLPLGQLQFSSRKPAMAESDFWGAPAPSGALALAPQQPQPSGISQVSGSAPRAPSCQPLSLPAAVCTRRPCPCSLLESCPALRSTVPAEIAAQPAWACRAPGRRAAPCRELGRQRRQRQRCRLGREGPRLPVAALEAGAAGGRRP